MSESDSEVTPAHLLHLSPLLFDQPIPETPSVPEHENRRRISLLSARRSDARPSFITRLLKEFERDAPERRHSFSLAVEAVAAATNSSRRNSVNPSCIGFEDQSSVAAALEDTEAAQGQPTEQEPVPPASARTLEVDAGTNLDIFGQGRKSVHSWAQTPTPTRIAHIPVEEPAVASPSKAVEGVSLPLEPVGSAPATPSTGGVDCASGVTNTENDANLPLEQASRDPSPEPASPDQQHEQEESPAPLIVEEPTNTEIEPSDGFEPLHPEGLSTILEEDSALEAFTPVKHHNLPTRSSPMKPSSPTPGQINLGTPGIGTFSPAIIRQESISLQELPSEAPSSPTPIRRATPEKFGVGAQPSATSHRRYSAAHELLMDRSSAPTAANSAIGASSPATSQQETLATEERPEEMPTETGEASETTLENQGNEASSAVAVDQDEVSDEAIQSRTSSPAPIRQITPEKVDAPSAISPHLDSATQNETVEEEVSATTFSRQVTPEITNINVSCSPVGHEGNTNADHASETALAPSSPKHSPSIAEETITVKAESPRPATPVISDIETPASPARDLEDSTPEGTADDTPTIPASAASIQSNRSDNLMDIEEHKEQPPTRQSPTKDESEDAPCPTEPNSQQHNAQEEDAGLRSTEPVSGPEEQSTPSEETTSEGALALSKNHASEMEDAMVESHSSPQSGGVEENGGADSSASFVDSFVLMDKDINQPTVPPEEDKEDETSDASSVMEQDESADRSMSTEQPTTDEVTTPSADALEDSSISQIRDATPEEGSDSIEAVPTESEDISNTLEDSLESSTSTPGDSDDDDGNSGDEIEVVEQVDAEDSLMSDDEDDVSLIAEQPIRVENDTLSLRSLHEESETDMIRKFISKVAADKSAKAAAAAELENRSPPEDDSGSPPEDSETPPKRTPLSEKSPNSPSPTKKRKLDELSNEPSKEESPKMSGESPVTRTVKRRKGLAENSPPPAEGEDSEDAPRRSTRQRKTLINLKSAPSANSIAKSTIPVRMPGMEMMDTVRARNEQKDVAAVTRYNTRKNKGSALFPQVVLKKMEKVKKQGKEYVYSSSSAENDKATETGKRKKNKGVRWAETLARYQDDEPSAPVNSKTRALSSSLLADVLKADAALDDDIDELADEKRVVSSKKVTTTPRLLKAKSQVKSRTYSSAPEATSKPSIPKPKKVMPPPLTPVTRRTAAAPSIPAPGPTPTTKILSTPAPKPTTSIPKVSAPPKRATRSGKSLVPTPIKVTATTKPKTSVSAAPPPPAPTPHRGPGRPRLNSMSSSSTVTSTPTSNKVTKTPAAASKKTVVTAAARRASRVAAGLGMSVNGTPAPKRRGRSAS